MASNSETGPAVIMANLELLFAYCNGWGPSYQPAKASIQLSTLQQLLLDGRASIMSVTECYQAYNALKNARIEAFEDFSKYITRVVNAVAVSELSPKLIEDIQGVARKIKGIRVGKKEKEVATNVMATAATTNMEEPTEPTALDDENGKAGKPKNHSVARTSRDQVIEHFSLLITLLQPEPMYQVNEPELQIGYMQQRLENMRMTNSSIMPYRVNWSNAIIARDELLYADNTGICDVALDVKKYVKAAYGAQSSQYRQISKLAFYSRKKK